MNLNTTAATRIGLNVLALLGASVAFYLGQSVFIPIVLASLLAVMLYPSASWLNRKLKFPWFLASLAVIIGLVMINLVVFTGFAVAIPQTLEEIPNPRDPDELRRIYLKSRDTVSSILPGSVDKILPPNPDNSTLFSYAKSFLEGGYITDQLLNLSKVGAAWFFQTIVILFILLFLLLEGDFLAARIKDLFGNNDIIQGQVAKALAEMADAMRSYLIWRTIVNIGLGVFLGVVYSICELRQPWTWALFTAVLCYVPYIGPLIAGIPPLIDATIHVNPWIALLILGLYLVVITVEGYVIVPWVMGHSMELNATTVMIACLYWDLIWGTTGLFLAMPIMAGIRAICMHVDGWRPLGSLMSTEQGFRDAEDAARIEALSKHVEESDATVIMDAFPPKSAH
jgi:AI-2 transport protein TqsA